jgi:PAS domain S-box-containing protein
MGLKLDTLFNNFFTGGITLASPDQMRRIKILNLFELVLFLLALFLGLFYLNIGVLPLFYVSVLASLLSLGVLIALRITRNAVLTGNLAVALLWALMLIIRWSSGGMSGEGLILLSWVWNGVLILLAIFVCGYMWGTMWACLVFIESGLAVILFRSEHEFVDLIPSEVSHLYSLGLYLTGLLGILLFAFLFEREREIALTQEEEKARMLTDSRSYMENILERLPVPTFVLDNNHRVVEWNRACHEFTGISPQDIVGRPVWEGLTLEDGGSMADKLLDNPDLLYEKYSDSTVSLSDSGSFSVETMLPKLRGGIKANIKASPILDQDGNVMGAIQIIQDIADSSESPRKGPGLMGSEGIDDSAFPVFKIDSKGKVSGWNNACESGFGYTVTQMMGKSPLTLVAKPYRRNFRDTVLQVLKGGSFKGKEWKYINSKGKPVYVLAKTYPIHDSSEKVKECVVINTDITELRIRIKEVGRRAAESEEKLKKVTESYNLLTKNIASFIRKKKDDE